MQMSKKKQIVLAVEALDRIARVLSGKEATDSAIIHSAKLCASEALRRIREAHNV